MATDTQVETKPFFPIGAIAFFTALIAFFVVFWFVIFWIMVARG